LLRVNGQGWAGSIKEFGQGHLLEGAHTDDLEGLVKTLFKPQLSSGYRNQQVGTDRRPNLAADRVFGATVKISNTQVLLDPFEEQFHLPPAFVEIADHLRSHLEIICQKDEDAMLVMIVKADAA